MLYVTTRSNLEPCTPQHVLKETRGTDGGLYLPFRIPVLSSGDIQILAEKSFNQRIADVLNLFFSGNLSAWDVDFSAGRYPVRLIPLRNRIVMAECWHNPEWEYQRLVKVLSALLSAENTDEASWVPLAIRIAVLFGILGERDILGEGPVDIAVVSGDFSVPLCAWYARQMGLPVGNIICCCNENKNLWDLMCLGQMPTDRVCISTIVPEADNTLPFQLERYLCVCSGPAAVARFRNACASASSYVPEDPLLESLRKGMFVSVVSSSRLESAIPNVLHTHGYLMTPASALAYSGLMDYRAKTGINRRAVVICDSGPQHCKEMISGLLGISHEDLKKMM